MKAMFFARPLEYRVEIPAERLEQGLVLAGRLDVSNRGPAELQGLTFAVGLAHADFKALKKDGSQAFAHLERQVLSEGASLAPGATAGFEFEFSLPPDFPVKTRDSGPFLLYGGDLDELSARGQLDLPVEPTPALERFIEALENSFSFEARGRKFSQGFLEVRYKPPESYPSMEELLARLKLDESKLSLIVRARLKSIGRGAQGGLKTRKAELQRDIPLAEFLTPGGHPNRPLFKEIWKDVLGELSPGVLSK